MYIYLMRIENTNDFKIGISINVEKRLKELQTGNPHKINILSTFKVKKKDDVMKIESSLHHLFKYSKKSGEWFEITDYSIPDLIAKFQSLCEQLENNFRILRENNNPYI